MTSTKFVCHNRHGADFTIQAKDGQTPYDVALAHNHRRTALHLKSFVDREAGDADIPPDFLDPILLTVFTGELFIMSKPALLTPSLFFMLARSGKDIGEPDL